MGWGAGDMNEQKRMEIYKQEVATIQKKSQQAMLTENRQFVAFKTAASREVARPMFVLSSWAIMAALSLQFEAAPRAQSETQAKVVDLCLSGICGGIKLACLFNLETERDAYVTSLSKLTNLSNFHQISGKNMKAIMQLITIGQSLANEMNKSWIHIIKAISQLEKMQRTILQTNSDVHKHSDPNIPKPSQLLLEFCNELETQTSVVVITRIFERSTKLSGQSIQHFFKAVCQTSLDEVGLDLKGNKNSDKVPSMYLLQKIVEISDYNMGRIRFEWIQIWRILQPYFHLVASHPDVNVSTFAVDSLRQLGMKILEREELGHFSSQHEFLKSFEWIIKHTKSTQIRDLILQSVSQMITGKAQSIRSGWKSIFQTLLKCAQTNEKMAMEAFSILKTVFNKHFELLVSANVFVDLVSCLAEFALIKGQGPAHDEQVMGSIQFLQSCTKSLMHRAEEEKKLSSDIGPKGDMVKQILLQNPSSAVMLTSPHAPLINNLPTQPYLLQNGLVSEEHFYLSWFPILSAFSRVVCESDSVLVRTHSMDVLFETFRTTGVLFGANYWTAIHRTVISPIFDDLCEATNVESNAAMLIHGLRNLIELISIHFDVLVEVKDYEFFQKSLDSIVLMISKHDEKLASTGQICLNQFLLNNTQKLADMDSWCWLISRIETSFSVTLPWELVICELETPATPNMNPLKSPLLSNVLGAASSAAAVLGNPIVLEQLNFEQTIIKCVANLELLQTIRDFALKPVKMGDEIISVIAHLKQKDSERILQCVYNSYAMARNFNCNIALRHAIYRRGWVPQLPNLVKQETVALQTYLLILFSTLKGQNVESTDNPLIEEIFDLLERACDFVNDMHKHQRDLTSWYPTLVIVYKEIIANYQHPLLSPHMKEFYKYAIKLMACEMQSLKNVLQEFLTVCADMLFIGQSASEHE
jgi:brefeldin A-inhibited guanine nucleotide-exchange protein